MSEQKDHRIYCTSYCNFGHRLSDGKPVDHECYILPPAALEAEREDNYELACELISKVNRVLHRRIKSKKES